MRAPSLALLMVVALASRAAAQQPLSPDVINRVMGRTAPVASAVSSAEVPAGTIRVSVVGPDDAPLPAVTLRLGIMNTDSSRESQECVTDNAGSCVFESLATGSQRSYRVNLPYQGARYSTTPFRLDQDQGHDVHLRALPTMRDQSRLLQVLGRTLIEFKDKRVHVTQESSLANTSASTFVFPDEGLVIPLPQGATAFQSQPSMGDQRVNAIDGALQIQGSIPPGRATLTWAYDLPLNSSSFAFENPVPFRTIEYQVLSDFVEGMSLSVDGFPEATAHESRNHKYFVARLMRRPGDPPFDTLRVRLDDIPVGGLMPRIATLVALVLLFAGFFLAVRPPDQGAAQLRAKEERKRFILQQIAQLEAEFAAKEIGPKYHAARKRDLTDQLAAELAGTSPG